MTGVKAEIIPFSLCGWDAAPRGFEKINHASLSTSRFIVLSRYFLSFFFFSFFKSLSSSILRDCSPGFMLGLYQIQTLKQPVGHYMNCNWTLGQSFSALTWAKNCSESVESSDTSITSGMSAKHPTNAKKKKAGKCGTIETVCPRRKRRSCYRLNRHITVSPLIKLV